MAEHIELGKEGEDLAVPWLEEKGYTIVERNWKFRKLEIDIIAEKGKFLSFIEIKTRNFSSCGYPEDSVTKKKFKALKRGADEYLYRNPGHPWIQYQILAITKFDYREPEYFLIEDVFL